MYISILPACLLNALHMFLVPFKARRECPRTGVTNGCESPQGCWESNLGPVQEQQVLLTAQPSLQPDDDTIVLFRFSLSFHSARFRAVKSCAHELHL